MQRKKSEQTGPNSAERNPQKRATVTYRSEPMKNMVNQQRFSEPRNQCFQKANPTHQIEAPRTFEK